MAIRLNDIYKIVTLDNIKTLNKMNYFQLHHDSGYCTYMYMNPVILFYKDIFVIF